MLLEEGGGRLRGRLQAPIDRRFPEGLSVDLKQWNTVLGKMFLHSFWEDFLCLYVPVTS